MLAADILRKFQFTLKWAPLRRDGLDAGILVSGTALAAGGEEARGEN